MPKKPEKINFDEGVLGIYLPIGISLLFLTKNFQSVICGFLIWIVLFTIFYLFELKRYKLEKASYELEMIKYKNEFLRFQSQVVEYNKKLEFIHESRNDYKWMEQKRLEVTNELIKALKKPLTDYTSRKGSSEILFKQLLTKYFGDLIITDKTTEVFSYYQNERLNYDFELSDVGKRDNAYVPDFIFLHDKSNLTIDIEIDEPYTYNNPIHTNDSISDKRRNDYFRSINWFVIRFSERQILQYPIHCCREIALLIKDYTGDNTFLNAIKVKEEVPRDKMWTYSVAKEYSNMNTRKNYPILSNVLNSEFLLSGRWTSAGKKYLIDNSDIMEIDVLSNIEIDKGIYNLNIHPCGRLVMSVKWRKSQFKYILNAGFEKDLILTNLYNRNQITFQRS